MMTKKELSLDPQRKWGIPIRMWRLIVFGLVVTASLVVVLSIVTWPALHTRSISSCDRYNLTEGEFSNLVAAASGGDLGASSRLFHYYMWSRSDCESAARWLKKVAAAGDATSQCSLGTLYLICDGMIDTNKALFWYERATEGGDSLARQSLRELRAQINSKDVNQ